MRRTQHGAHLTQLTYLRLVNAYLVREDDGLTLVDTLAVGAAEGILAAARQLGRPITRIVLTHAHFDHAGTLDALAPQLTDAEVLIGTREARFLAGDTALGADEPPGKIKSMKRTATRPTRTLEPGDRVGSLEVRAAPGHTPGQIALLDTRDGTLLAGDAWIAFGSVSTAAKPELPMPLTAMGTWHRPTALASARALRALDPSRLAAGHGPVREHPLEAMDAALARATGVTPR